MTLNQHTGLEAGPGPEEEQDSEEELGAEGAGVFEALAEEGKQAPRAMAAL